MTAPSASARGIARAGIWVTGGMLLGRAAGIARELIIAERFGATRDADIAILLVAGPEILVTLVGTGALGLLLIPVLLDLDEPSQARFVMSLSRRLVPASVALALVTAVVVIYGTRDWSSEAEASVATYRWSVGIAALALPPSIAAALTNSLLRARDRFAVTSLATLLFTGPVLAALLIGSSLIHLAIGVAAGASVRYLSQVVAVGRGWLDGRRVPPRPASIFPRRELGIASLTSVLVAAQASLPLLIAAATGESGDVALLNYAWKLLVVPIGVLGSLFSVAAYPSIVRYVKATDRSGLGSPASIAQPIFALAFFAAAWTAVHADGVALTLFGSADIGTADLDLIAKQLRIGAMAIPLITIGAAVATLLFALQRRRLALATHGSAGIVLLATGVALSIAFGPAGIVSAAALYGLTLTACGSLLLHRASEFSLVNRFSAACYLVLAAISAAFCFAVRSLVPVQSALTLAANIAIPFTVAGCCGAAFLVVRRARVQADAS